VSPVSSFISWCIQASGGGENWEGLTAPLAKAEAAPRLILNAGLQGAGKDHPPTATTGLHLKEQGRRALMVAADV